MSDDNWSSPYVLVVVVYFSGNHHETGGLVIYVVNKGRQSKVGTSSQGRERGGGGNRLATKTNSI